MVVEYSSIQESAGRFGWWGSTRPSILQCGEEVHNATATGDDPRLLARLRLEMSMFIDVM
jgi:hypothetical protein